MLSEGIVKEAKETGKKCVTTEICIGSRDKQNNNAETQLTNRADKLEKLWQDAWEKVKELKMIKCDYYDHRRQGIVISTHNTLLSLILENVYD